MGFFTLVFVVVLLLVWKFSVEDVFLKELVVEYVYFLLLVGFRFRIFRRRKLGVEEILKRGLLLFFLRVEVRIRFLCDSIRVVSGSLSIE